MTTPDIFASDYQEDSHWLDDVTSVPACSTEIPRSSDVVVIGSGYTGLNAALVTARAGRRTVVLEAGEPGAGCSTRNGGQISTSIKPPLVQLTQRYGRERAQALHAEGGAALEWIETFVEEEGIDCNFQRRGRFHAAHTPAIYETLARDSDRLRAEEGIQAFAVPGAEQKQELGSDFYHGGVVFPRHASLHPAKYHHGLLERALAAGVDLVPHCQAQNISRHNDGFAINTHKGVIQARDVVVATNGYTTALTPWLYRRAIPIGSYIIATEPVSRDLIEGLFPTGRIASDSRRAVYYFRASPDRRRVAFGGRVSARESNPRITGPLLYAEMCKIFPQLNGTKISYSWMGTVAYSFDELAHIGTHEGIHYAMCYCGSGVSMASYFGRRLGQKVLGVTEGRTAFDDLPFPTRPLYTGTPWFLPAVVAWYRWRDRLETSRATA